MAELYDSLIMNKYCAPYFLNITVNITQLNKGEFLNRVISTVAISSYCFLKMCFPSFSLYTLR